MKRTVKKSPPRCNSPQSPGGSPKRKPIRPIDRQKMRRWLELKLNSDEMPHHLWWIEKDLKLKFAVRWPHAARHGFCIDDAKLFKAWAKHTGIHKDGDQEDHKKWKSNFRCALHSLPDCKELTTKDQRRGQAAVRIYEFLDAPKEKKAGKKSSRSRETRSISEESTSDSGLSADSICATYNFNLSGIPTPNPDCNIPDFSRLGVSTSTASASTILPCIQINHLCGGTLREIKKEDHNIPASPTFHTTTSMKISYPVPVIASQDADDVDMLNEDAHCYIPVGIVTRVRTLSGDSGNPESPPEEIVLEDGTSYNFNEVIEEFSDDGIALSLSESNESSSDDDIQQCTWSNDLLDISNEAVAILVTESVITEQIEADGLEEYVFTSTMDEIS